METNLLEYILWNYMPYNNGSQGDWWNGEDLSIRSEEKRNRGIDAVARPHVYGIKGNGTIRSQNFDMFTSTYRLEVETDCSHDGGKEEGTLFEIFVPACRFPTSLMSITPKSGKANIIDYDWPKQTIMWTVFECKDGVTIM
jgi:hypothetical protein